MDAGSLCKIVGSTVLVVAAGVGVKLAIDYIKKDVDLDIKAAAFDSNEYKQKLKSAKDLTEICKEKRKNIDEFEAYVDVLKSKLNEI